MNNKHLLDLDDTLINTSWLYTRARNDLVEKIEHFIGQKTATREEILDLQIQTELKSLKTMGFSQENFPSSMRKAFEQIARKYGLRQKLIKEGKQQAYEIGMQVYNPLNWEPRMILGAEETLDFLREQGDELYLVTAGDKRVQKRKIDFYGIERWFKNRIHIVPKDKRQAILEISKGFPKERVYFIGNSPSSDILPALECGINAVYIPKTTWDFDSHPAENENHHRKITIPRISDIIGLYATEFSN